MSSAWGVLPSRTRFTGTFGLALKLGEGGIGGAPSADATNVLTLSPAWCSSERKKSPGEVLVCAAGTRPGAAGGLNVGRAAIPLAA